MALDLDGAAPAVIAEGAGGSGNEGEITPKMIEAGVSVLDYYRPQYDGLKATVMEIYVAMRERATSTSA